VYQYTYANDDASIFFLADPGGLKQVTSISVPSNAWQEYVSESHFWQRYASDTIRCWRVRVANGGDAVGRAANICFRTGKDMGEVTERRASVDAVVGGSA
jgi:hypothetical protein